METLRDSIKKLIEKTLTMEDPRLNKIPESQPYSDNEEDSTMTEELEKSQDFSQQTENKIVNRLKIKYTATRIKYLPTRIKSRNFLSNISYTGIKWAIFIMKVLS